MAYPGAPPGGYPGQQQYGAPPQMQQFGGPPQMNQFGGPPQQMGGGQQFGGMPGAMPGGQQFGGNQMPGAQFGGNPQWGGGAPPVNPEVQNWFSAVDADRSGKISAEELQSALVNANGRKFEYDVCKMLIGMFDPHRSGLIDIYGFQQLYNYVNQWLTTFKGFDKNNSGSVDKQELNQALQQMGYRFSPNFVDVLLQRYDPVSRSNLTTDQFILACILIQRITDAFRSRDTEMKGIINISYEDFLQVIFTALP